MNVALITIGNRDIKVEGKDLPGELKGCREEGKYLLDNYSEFKSNIRLPIIQPFLDILAIENKKIDRFILVATDQDNLQFQSKDTIHFAETIKLCLDKKLPDSKKTIVTIQNNVNDYHSNYQYFHKKLKNKLPACDVERLYLLPVGGMPNINSPLILVSIMIYREKVFQYCVNEDTKTARPIPFNRKFLKELEKERIIPALNKFFFASAADISSDDFIRGLALYAYNRLSFNFNEALHIITDLIYRYPDKNLSFFIDSILVLKNSFSARIAELFFTVKIKIIQEQYVDALLRLYNLTDNLLLNKVIEMYELTEPDENQNYDTWWRKMTKQILKSNPGIVSIMEPIQNSTPDLNRPGLPLYERLIKFKDANERLLELVKPMITITDLRNKSIGAHGFQGVSKEIITQRLKKFEIDIPGLITVIESYLKVRFEDSVYYKVKRIIQEVL